MKSLVITLFIITMICGYVYSVDHIFTLPIEGNFTITAGWNYPPSYGGGNHFGVDYSAVPGTKILAAYGGQVTEVQENIPDGTGTDYGNYIVVNHGNGHRTKYAHMLYNSANVSVGEYVYQGKFIGRVGDTGNSSGPHLHFEDWYNNVRIDTYGWYSNDVMLYRGGCNPEEHYFVSNPPTLPSIPEQSRILPDDLLVHLLGTGNYYWIRDGFIKQFPSETPFYTWGFDWGDAVDITQEEFNSFPTGSNIEPKVGTCVYDENSQRWVFDYQSDNSTVIVKRRVNNYQQLGYAVDVWIPSSSSYLSQFQEGPEVTSSNNYPYGTVLRSANNMSERYVIKRGAEISSSYAGQKMLLRILSDNTYFINYYHQNFNIVVTQTVLNYYQMAPYVSYEKIMDGQLVSGAGPSCYYIENGYKRLITDELTFNTYGFNFANVFEITDSELSSFVSGDNIEYFSGGGATSNQGGLFEDGGFDSGTTNYWLFNDSQEIGNFSVTQGDVVDGFYKAQISINSPVLFYQEELMQLVSVNANTMYHLSFRAKSNGTSNLKVCLQNHSDPWNNYGLWKEITLTPNWTKYQYIFIANTTDESARIDFMLGDSSGDIFFDKIIFEQVGDIDPPPNNMIQNADFELGHFAPFVVGDLNFTASYYTDESVYYNGSNSMYIDPNQNGLHFEVQLYQNVNIVSGQEYELLFWAKSQSPRQAQIELYNENEPWDNFGLWQEIDIGTDWQNYTISFIATNSGLARISWNLGEEDIPIWIDDINMPDRNFSSWEIDVPIVNFTNCPNPFKGQTKIIFNLKNQSKVDLCIYNIKGQLVKTIVSSQLKSGNHEIAWDAKDNNFNNCSSGIYLCTLRVDNKSFTRKIIISK